MLNHKIEILKVPTYDQILCYFVCNSSTDTSWHSKYLTIFMDKYKIEFLYRDPMEQFIKHGLGAYCYACEGFMPATVIQEIYALYNLGGMQSVLDYLKNSYESNTYLLK